ncbi:hypothetical protein B566_EDAN017590 [Ephemera danica]|nr:hypothetical protein B566_EDAN017590 [Ephemera danica]
MDGKTVVVTGADSGMEKETALDLARRGASVRNFVQLVKQRTSKLHVLVNNAGVGRLPDSRTEDGLQTTMQINHFGPMLLTLLLLVIRCILKDIQTEDDLQITMQINHLIWSHVSYIVALRSISKDIQTKDDLQITMQIKHLIWSHASYIVSVRCKGHPD